MLARSRGWSCSIPPAPAVLVELLEPRQPVPVQIAAVRALSDCESADAATILLARLRGFEPPAKSAAIETLLSRADWTKRLLEAMDRNDPASGVAPGLINPALRAPLLKHRNAEIARLAQKLFAQACAFCARR